MNSTLDGLRVALAFDWLTTSGGGEQVLLAAHHLFPTAPIYTSLYAPHNVPQFSGATVNTSYLQLLPYAHKRHQLLIPLMPAAFESFNFKEFDAVISIGNGFSKGIITVPGQFHLSYCQTPPRYLWNLGNDSRNRGRLDSPLRAIAEHQLRIWDVVSAARPDRILANSQTVADRIAKIYRRQADVLYPPVDTDLFLPTEQPTNDYFLSVGRLVGYKRIDILISACLKSGQLLKIVGEGPERNELEKQAQGSSLIQFLGRQPIERLQELYANAKAFLFAGEEDFGIVPVEAMSAGRPVLAYNKGGLTESVLDGVTGMLYPMQSSESLVAAISIFDPNRYDSKTIRQHAKKFSTSVFIDGLRQAVIEGVCQ